MKHVSLLLILLFFVSCGRERKHKEVHDYETGVALVQCTNYYTIRFSQGFVAYFSNVDEEGNLNGFTLDENEIESANSYGTAFFVNSKGVLATNYHVAYPNVDDNSVRNTIVANLNYYASEFNTELEKINQILGAASYASTNGERFDDDTRKKLIELNQKKQGYENFINAVSQLSYSDFKITTHSSLSVAFNNSCISKSSTFEKCNIIAGDSSNDLALIQLQSRVTPDECHVFNVPNGNMTNNRRSKRRNNESTHTDGIVGKELTLIGYNLGPQLALTATGIKPQVTKGNISQDTDVSRIMYTIPALPGSSGSPVIDTDGNLVAINHAGMSTTQSFNFGIKAMHLYNLMNTSNMME